MSFENPEKSIIEERVLESKREEADLAAQQIVKDMVELGWSSDEAEEFSLAITEAFANAIVHGNNEDPNKKVRVNVEITKDDAKIVVTDEGEGFDPSKIPTPTEGEGLTATHGRGVFMMAEYSDSPEFIPGKGEVILRKHRKV